MALRGNLRDFSLPDVFQLVQLSGKTGVLRILGADAEGSIWFREGEVFFAQSNWRRDQLGQRLVSTQKITPAALQKALDVHASEPEGGRRLGQILVDEGYITQQVLETFVQEQIQDTIFDIMRWDEGDFDFEVLPEVVHEDIGLSVSVENIVMEGSRRLEEWNRIKKKVPSTDMVFKMATAPGEGTFEISLKPVEWNLLLLVDGTRSVRELAVETRRTDFEVARVIYGLFSAGLLEVASDEEVERLRAERAQREDKQAALRASRTAREEAQKAEALDLEAKLAADAEARLAGTSAAQPKAAPEAAVEPEMPEFLTPGVAQPSSDDMAVFEQMMSAVLAPPTAPTVAEPVIAPEPAVVPEPQPVEAEEPAVHVSEPPLITEEVVEAPGYGAISDVDIAGIPAPPVAETPALGTFVPTGDFEADLRTLGLGEYPSELLEPETAEGAEPELSFIPAEEVDEQPAVEMGEPDAVVAVEEEEDLDQLLRSLEAETGSAAGVISSGTDYGAEEPAPSGVISTDAYLAEFDSGVGLNGGLGDELTALTGGGSGRTRPVTTVAKIPEANEGAILHRDQMVDKDLVKKIIEGISRL